MALLEIQRTDLELTEAMTTGTLMTSIRTSPCCLESAIGSPWRVSPRTEKKILTAISCSTRRGVDVLQVSKRVISDGNVD